MPVVALQIFLATVPYLALAAVGVILFRRERTLVTALIALGFATVAASHVLAAFVSYEFSYAYKSGGTAALAVGRFPGWVYSATYWGNIVGPWVAAASLLWHTMWRATASPNNRWRGP